MGYKNLQLPTQIHIHWQVIGRYTHGLIIGYVSSTQIQNQWEITTLGARSIYAHETIPRPWQDRLPSSAGIPTERIAHCEQFGQTTTRRHDVTGLLRAKARQPHFPLHEHCQLEPDPPHTALGAPSDCREYPHSLRVFRCFSARTILPDSHGRTLQFLGGHGERLQRLWTLAPPASACRPPTPTGTHLGILRHAQWRNCSG